MISKIDIYIVIWATLYNFSRTFSFYCLLIAFQYCKKVLWINVNPCIVFGNIFVHIWTSGIVFDDSFCWILSIVSNIIIHHHYDMIIINTMFMEYLICMAHISLMPVVVPPLGSCNQHCPLLLGLFHCVHIGCCCATTVSKKQQGTKS